MQDASATLAPDSLTAVGSLETLRVSVSEPLQLAITAAPNDPLGTLLQWLVPALIGLLGALAGAVVAGRYQKYALQKSHEEARRVERREDIARKLDEFYGPVSILLYESEMWHDLLKNGDDYRTLTALIGGRRFTGDDAALLDEVMRTTDQISALIVEKGGLVEEEPSELTVLLSKARTHYRLLRLAAGNKLTEDAERFGNYVYPKELDDALRDRKAELEEQLRALGGTPLPTPSPPVAREPGTAATPPEEGEGRPPDQRPTSGGSPDVT